MLDKKTKISDNGKTSQTYYNLYAEFLLFKDSAAYAAMQKWHRNLESTHSNNKLIQGVVDSFDYPISYPNGLKQTHSMEVIMTQEHSSTNKKLKYNQTHI